MFSLIDERDLEKSALRGEPSYVWRAGQERRFQMILVAAGDRISGRVLENGCGIGVYLERLGSYSRQAIGLEYDFQRARDANQRSGKVVNAEGENLPFPENYFDLILSHEVIEHVADDRQVILEIVRALKLGGLLVLFTPNRGYPFETHGIYWRGRYRFGNIPLINYLPSGMRDRLAPHVRAYSHGDLEKLFVGLPVKILERKVIFGAYDNIIARFPYLGRLLRIILQALEDTPLRWFGLSHLWIVEKTDQTLKS